ncbi:hypothetical protein U9M48_031789 [Paspalum notatum var. saurae]|uniref:Uncharacterized protein n=1 Tax=Paspalum notatum var. saurae TaxID=547442 RepID=A0AAQ3U6I0_PASNO
MHIKQLKTRQGSKTGLLGKMARSANLSPGRPTQARPTLTQARPKMHQVMDP